MTEKDAIELKWILIMRDLPKDPEMAHGDADEILLEMLYELGYCAIVREFRQVRDRIGFWYA